MGQISVSIVTALVLTVLSTQTVNSAPTLNDSAVSSSVAASTSNVIVGDPGFMAVLYNRLSLKNHTVLLYPPRYKDVEKSPLYQQVNSQCQSKENQTNASNIPYACAAMVDVIYKIWDIKNADKIISTNNITLPSTLEEIYKDDDLKSVVQFCQGFTESLTISDFEKELLSFVKHFISNQNGNPQSCETICQNSTATDEVKDNEQVHPVCAIWRRGYTLYKSLIAGTQTDAVVDKANSQPLEKSPPESVVDLTDDANLHTDGTSNKPKRKDFVADQPGVGAVEGSIQLPLVSSSTANVKASEVDVDLQKSEKPIIKESSTEGKSNGSVIEDKKSEQVAEDKKLEQVTGDQKSEKVAEDKKPEQLPEKVNDKEEIKGSSSTPKSQNSSSTSASVPGISSVDNTNKDAPAPPIPNKITTEKSLSVPKPSIGQSGQIGSGTIIKPINKKPTNASPGTKVEQTQNETPVDTDYEDAQVPPVDNDDKAYKNEDDSAMNSGFDQSLKQKLKSVEVIKEKHTGDDMEVDKVRIDGENATVNVAFNEDPGVINYFVCFLGILAICYLLFHNKKRLIAYVVEGRKPQTGRRRSSSTSYRKLENNYD